MTITAERKSAVIKDNATAKVTPVRRKYRWRAIMSERIANPEHFKTQEGPPLASWPAQSWFRTPQPARLPEEEKTGALQRMS